MRGSPPSRRGEGDAPAAGGQEDAGLVYVLPREEWKPCREAWFPVHKKFESVIGKDILEATYEIAKRHE